MGLLGEFHRILWGGQEKMVLWETRCWKRGKELAAFEGVLMVFQWFTSGGFCRILWGFMGFIGCFFPMYYVQSFF